MRSRCGRRAFMASPIRCVGERIMATGVPEFREVAWRACRYLLNNVLESSRVFMKSEWLKSRVAIINVLPLFLIFSRSSSDSICAGGDSLSARKKILMLGLCNNLLTS
ncbi:hypothetical protein [Bathymodiolus japonicus methanotrophic gill symbiont]|uniref:hypothetical protein n=1 Tax=Bathymodiolus japonicus methanotrophic gill symbiont TaxID=113269 RepID=UPI001C8EA0EC|nr:hypothetical protein [Bathymodiolus japonicus methanotrophic gill symbiont]